MALDTKQEKLAAINEITHSFLGPNPDFGMQNPRGFYNASFLVYVRACVCDDLYFLLEYVIELIRDLTGEITIINNNVTNIQNQVNNQGESNSSKIDLILNDISKLKKIIYYKEDRNLPRFKKEEENPRNKFRDRFRLD